MTGGAQIPGMTLDTVENLEKLGLDAAREIAGPDAVEDVEVAIGVDRFGRDTYDFTVLFDPDRSRMRIGLVLIRLLQKLGDTLEARGDEHHVAVHLLGQQGWQRRAGVRNVF